MPLDFFSKTKLPEIIPQEIGGAIVELKNTSDKRECLKKAYDILSEKYHGQRVATYLKLFVVLSRSIEGLWQRNGFMHCTNINFLLRFLLVKSGHFSEQDVRLRWTTIWYISPHQYVQVNTDGQWINIDIWAKTYGIKFGDYAHGFHA